MTNFEKYSDEIKAILKDENNFAVTKDGRVKVCGNCNDCIFCDCAQCRIERVKWLYEEAEKTRDEQLMEIENAYLDMCGLYSHCRDCPCRTRDGVNCRITFTYDYLKEKENKQ